MTRGPRIRRRLAGSATGAARRSAVLAVAGAIFLGSGLVLLAGPFTQRGTQPPLTHPISPPGFSACRSCHYGYSTETQPTHEPFDSWAGSMMANASRDPIFWAALDVANRDVPGIGDFCLRCHVPTGWYSGRSEPPGGSVDGCGLIGPIDEPDTDFEGVSCHYCHRVMVNPTPPPGEFPVYQQNGQAWLDDGICLDDGGSGKSEPCRRGPYDYPLGGPDTEPPHPWAFSAHHLSGSMCGNCHNVTSPVKTLIDENGADTGIPYPIERTHREWQQSAFGNNGATPTPCQTCHMPVAQGASDIYACIFQINERAGNLPVHQFAGGNTWVPAVLRDEYPNLGRTDEYNDTLAWTGEMLHSAADLELDAPAEAQPNQAFDVDVRVTNLSGHKLPTGYTEGRRMWLQVRIEDADGGVVWESGAYDPATGILTTDAQAKVYESKPGIWDRNGDNECATTDAAGGGGNPIFHFALNDCIAKDNRIPPRGFTGGANLETRPVDYTYPETFPGSGILVHWDDTDYQVTLPVGTKSPITIETRLYYQTVSKEYVEFLRDQAVTHNFPDDCIQRTSGPVASSRGEILYDLWVEHDRSAPFEMDLATAQVTLGRLFIDGFESGNTLPWSSTVP